MTNLRFGLITVWLAAGLLLEGCAPKALSPLPHRSQADARFTQFVEKSLSTDWYGIYMQENKIGYLKSTFRRQAGPDGASYLIELSGTMHLPSQDEVDKIEMGIVAEFRARPPYPLIRYADKTIHKNDVSEINIVSMADGYQANITQGGQTHTQPIGPFDYTLKDYTAVQSWIAQNPIAGAAIKYRHLNLATLNIQENTARIEAIHDAVASGVRITYYNVITKGCDELEIQEVFGADGTAYSIFLGQQFECRLEPQALATKIDTPVDLFVSNTVAINRLLGDSEKVTLLKFSIDHISGALLGDAPGQSVTPDPASDSFIATINPAGAHQLTATDEEIKKNLAATTDIPANHPKIISLARKAVGDAGTTAEKVGRLVKFVYQYLEDDYTANPLTVLDIIAKKKGDCSEHAQLFTAMARSLKIPCRTVGGLIYLGDAFQEFGLHAWNEVVINGVWVPVDPAWDQTLIDATHIRFPVDISQEWQIMAAIGKMKLTVLQVEHKK